LKLKIVWLWNGLVELAIWTSFRTRTPFPGAVSVTGSETTFAVITWRLSWVTAACSSDVPSTTVTSWLAADL
jgi:hypothetical protein